MRLSGGADRFQLPGCVHDRCARSCSNGQSRYIKNRGVPRSIAVFGFPGYDVSDGRVQNPRTNLSHHLGSGHDFRAIQTAHILLLFTVFQVSDRSISCWRECRLEVHEIAAFRMGIGRTGKLCGERRSFKNSDIHSPASRNRCFILRVQPVCSQGRHTKKINRPVKQLMLDSSGNVFYAERRAVRDLPVH